LLEVPIRANKMTERIEYNSCHPLTKSSQPSNLQTSSLFNLLVALARWLRSPAVEHSAFHPFGVDK